MNEKSLNKAEKARADIQDLPNVDSVSEIIGAKPTFCVRMYGFKRDFLEYVDVWGLELDMVNPRTDKRGVEVWLKLTD